MNRPPLRIVFRADASTAIGAGHVVRCATLASELATRGATIHFLCRTLPGDYCAWLETRGFGVTRLSVENLDEEIAASRAALAALGSVAWLVVDHYGLDACWERALRPLAERLLVIDDTANRPHDCDLLLDQNLVAGAAGRYTGLLPPQTECLLGPRHALLPPAFAAARAGRHVRDGEVRRILLCFGGSDPQGHTLAALDALRAHAGRLARIDVVVGPANPARTAIAAACQGLPAVLHCPAEDMAGLLAEADLAIGAGGTMNWERACIGVPTLAFGIAGNQRPVLEAMIEGGYAVGTPQMTPPDPAGIAAWLAVLLANPPLLRGLAERGRTLVDGEGTRRVADRLLPAPLAFRAARQDDCAALLRWRNHPSVRAVSHDPAEIDAATHAAWLERTLGDPRRLLLIAERQGEAVGVVRFDLDAPRALISVYRVPGSTARGGLIRAAGDWLAGQRPEIRHIVAEVLPDNTASLAAFHAAGYRDSRHTLVLELETP